MVKATSFVLAAFAAGMVAQPSSASTPAGAAPAVTAVKPSPAALDMLKDMLGAAEVTAEPARAFIRYFKRSFKRFVRAAA